MKNYRQNAILEIIDLEPISSQEQLRKRLHEKGIEATQGTLSRDIRDLGLVKRAADGAYSRPGAAAEADAHRIAMPRGACSSAWRSICVIELADAIEGAITDRAGEGDADD